MRIKDGCERAAAENVAACGCAVEPRQTNQDSRLAYKASIPAVDVPVRREAAEQRERASEPPVNFYPTGFTSALIANATDAHSPVPWSHRGHASSISGLFLKKDSSQEMGVIKGGDVLAAV
jgi:hypothetical protein